MSRATSIGIGGVAGPMTARGPNLVDSVDRLVKLRTELEDAVNALGNKLSPIMSPDNPVPVDPRTGPPGPDSLTAMLDRELAQLQNLHREIDSFLQRLHL